MIVDKEEHYTNVTRGRRTGLDLVQPLYVGGVPNYNQINRHADVNTGFIGCISRLVIGEKKFDLMGNQTESVGIESCKTCSESLCNNGGVCQEAPEKEGYICLCRERYGGKNCDTIGEFCGPGELLFLSQLLIVEDKELRLMIFFFV